MFKTILTVGLLSLTTYSSIASAKESPFEQQQFDDARYKYENSIRVVEVRRTTYLNRNSTTNTELNFNNQTVSRTSNDGEKEEEEEDEYRKTEESWERDEDGDYWYTKEVFEMNQDDEWEVVSTERHKEGSEGYVEKPSRG